jgi:hypothetical protein
MRLTASGATLPPLWGWVTQGGLPYGMPPAPPPPPRGGEGEGLDLAAGVPAKRCKRGF